LHSRKNGGQIKMPTFEPSHFSKSELITSP
jgi:hypothetical protein